MHLRAEKLARQFQKEVSLIISRELYNPDIGFVTVTSVRFNENLKKASIYVSVLEEGKKVSKSIEGLNKAKGFIRTELAKRVTIRFMPEIEFIEDSHQDEIAHTLNIIKGLESGEKN